jgi:transcriptional regulator with XRE-family HTH domain
MNPLFPGRFEPGRLGRNLQAGRTRTKTESGIRKILTDYQDKFCLVGWREFNVRTRDGRVRPGEERRMEKSQPRIVMDVLHDLLRSRGLRYRDIAGQLGVTERTVTRWFSTDGVDTRVIDRLCTLAQISFFDLCELAGKRVDRRVCHLSVRQEQALADDDLLNYLFAQICQGWTFADFLQELELPESYLIAALIRLEKIEVIEFLPGNEIRLRTAKDIEFRRNGPYAKCVNRWLARSLDRPDIEEPASLWAFDSLKLSPASIELLRQKCQALRQEARKLSDMDRHLNAGKRSWFSLIFTARPVRLRPVTEWATDYAPTRGDR